LDIAYLNITGTFYFIASLLDGYSRSIVHWEIREKMEEVDIETIVQRAREKFPGKTPRIITDNGPQFIAKDFKEFIRICGMTRRPAGQARWSGTWQAISSSEYKPSIKEHWHSQWHPS